MSLQASGLAVSSDRVELEQCPEERYDLFPEEIAVTAALLSALFLEPSGPIRAASNPKYNT